MKKFAQVTIIILALLFATVPPASAGTGTGLLLGLFLGGALDNSTTVVPGSGPEEILYQMPNMTERVSDPLEVRFASAYGNFGYAGNFRGGRSLKELLMDVVGKQEEGTIVILQAKRRFDPASPSYAVVWFAYVRSEFLQPAAPHQPEKQ